MLGCDLLSHTAPHGNQSVSALPSSCSSAPPGSGPGSCLEELPPGQTASGKTSPPQLALRLLGVSAHEAITGGPAQTAKANREFNTFSVSFTDP